MNVQAMALVLAPIAFAGHSYLAATCWSRLNGWGLKRRIVKPLSLLLLLATLALPVLCVFAQWPQRGQANGDRSVTWYGRVAFAYESAAAAVALIGYPVWLYQRLTHRHVRAMTERRGEVVDIAARLGRLPVAGWETNLLARLPGNQLTELEINRKTLELENLPERLSGLKVLHLSDLHMANRLEADFFQEAVLLSNQLEPDVVCVTGDLIDKHECLSWLSEILGELSARYGVYYVLGNHDERIGDLSLIHNELKGRGWTHLGSRWRTILIEGEELLLAGNELPWLGKSPDMTNAPPGTSDGGMFRMLLAHTPDQFPWAKQHAFDLMLAGHNHGGQIHFPFLGPVVAPSIFGVKYASGVFHERPTLLHVSQGAGSYFPFRFNCRQEVTLLTLQPSSLSKQPASAAETRAQG